MPLGLYSIMALTREQVIMLSDGLGSMDSEAERPFTPEEARDYDDLQEILAGLLGKKYERQYQRFYLTPDPR